MKLPPLQIVYNEVFNALQDTLGMKQVFFKIPPINVELSPFAVIDNVESVSSNTNKSRVFEKVYVDVSIWGTSNDFPLLSTKAMEIKNKLIEKNLNLKTEETSDRFSTDSSSEQLFYRYSMSLVFLV